MLTCVFFSCDLLHKDGSISTPFPSDQAIEMIDSLAENFKIRFSDFHGHVTHTHISENAASIEDSDAPEKLLPQTI